MVDNQVVSMTENGVLISSDSGQFSIHWSELKAGHFLIKDGQSFQLGIQVATYTMIMKAANQECELPC